MQSNYVFRFVLETSYTLTFFIVSSRLYTFTVLSLLGHFPVLQIPVSHLEFSPSRGHDALMGSLIVVYQLACSSAVVILGLQFVLEYNTYYSVCTVSRTRQRALVDSKLRPRPLEMSVISTHLNGMLKLHLVDLLSIYYTTTFATHIQQIVPMELKPQCMPSLASMGVNHGGCGDAWDVGMRPPQNLERGDANTNCPPRFRPLLSDPDPARPT